MADCLHYKHPTSKYVEGMNGDVGKRSEDKECCIAIKSNGLIKIGYGAGEREFEGGLRGGLRGG